MNNINSGPIMIPITGQEQIEDIAKPVSILTQFYRAFNGGDMDLMQQNWLKSESASMSNPLGGIKRGWSEIAQVYDAIFNGPAQVYVEYYDYTIVEYNGFFQAVGRERGHFSIGGRRIDLQIRTSRTYALEGGSYKQLHHHGSIEDPDLLNAYQTAVKTGVIN